MEKCPLKLSCGHECISFCGEPCPSVCRVKDCENYNEDTFTIYFGNEEDPDARFVLLQDCKQKCAIEEKALIKHLASNQNTEEEYAVKYNKCPKCST